MIMWDRANLGQPSIAVSSIEIIIIFCVRKYKKLDKVVARADRREIYLPLH